MAEPTPVVVTVAHGRHDHLAHQLRLLAASDPRIPHVVVAIDDADIAALVDRHRGTRHVTVLEHPTHPRGLPVAAARNRGVEAALAQGADPVVLLDVDCVAGPLTLRRYASLSRCVGPALLCGPVTYLPEGVVLPPAPEDLHRHRRPHPARPDPPEMSIVREGDHDLFWSLSAAVTPLTWTMLGGFCEDYVGYGGEDTDLAQVARREGVELVWVGGADAYHQYHPVRTPPVEHLGAIVRNARLFHRRWGRWPMSGWLGAFADAGLVRWSSDAFETVR